MAELLPKVTTLDTDKFTFDFKESLRLCVRNLIHHKKDQIKFPSNYGVKYSDDISENVLGVDRRFLSQGISKQQQNDNARTGKKIFCTHKYKGAILHKIGHDRIQLC